MHESMEHEEEIAARAEAAFIQLKVGDRVRLSYRYNPLMREMPGRIIEIRPLSKRQPTLLYTVRWADGTRRSGYPRMDLERLPNEPA